MEVYLCSGISIGYAYIARLLSYDNCAFLFGELRKSFNLSLIVISSPNTRTSKVHNFPIYILIQSMFILVVLSGTEYIISCLCF